MYCFKCGKQNNDVSNYCAQCGQFISQELSTISSNSTRKLSLNIKDHTDNKNQHAEETSYSHISKNEIKTKKNFIVKFWCGDYSLPVSYWVIGVVVNAILYLLVTAFAETISDMSLSPLGIFLSLTVMYSFISSFTIWQLVGIWRSAERYKTLNKFSSWGGVAQFMVMIALLRFFSEMLITGFPLIIETGKNAFGESGIVDAKFQVLNNASEIELSGGMNYGTAQKLETFLKSSPTLSIIHLNNYGGYLSEGYKLAKLIKQYDLITYTSTECDSACTIAFLAGKEKLLGEQGKIGFHSTSIGNISGELITEINAEYASYLRKHNIPGHFIKKAIETSADKLWFPTHAELIDANVIDAIVDPAFYGFSGVSSWKSIYDIEKSLLKIKLFSTIKTYDKDNYQRLLKILTDSYKQRLPLIKIQDNVRSFMIGKLFPTYISKAPSSTILKYMNTQLAEMKYLKKTRVNQCVALVFPGVAKEKLQIAKWVSSKLLFDDLNAMSLVVEESFTKSTESINTVLAEQQVENIWLEIVDIDETVLKVFTDPKKYQDNPDTLCYSGIVFFETILGQPVSESGNVFRYMFSSM